MGCQSSKAKKATEPQPSRTLLATDEVPKTEGAATGAAPGDVPTTVNNSAVVVGPDTHNNMSNLQDGGTYNMRTARVLSTQRYDLDIMVSQFTSHDSTVGNAIGRNAVEREWKVMYDLDATPVDIKLHVQEHKLHSHEVSIESNGQPIFRGAGSSAKSKMTEDFCYQWPFRGMCRGINEINYFEVRPDRMNPNMWVPATITRQRDDGFFEVTARQLDQRGYLKDTPYPAVHKDDLREASSQKPLQLPESSLVLKVPKADPTHAQLSVEGQLVTYHFGRPSPPPRKAGEQKPKIALKVAKDRSKVEANVGHDVLSHFVSGEVRAISSEVERLMHSWSLQVGPFAKHTVKVCKNYTLGKIITLIVDDETFVECSPADLSCTGSGWQCNFKFVGEKVLDFEVYKTNSDGAALEETAHVEEKRKYTHECSVLIPNDRDFSTAQFFVDGVDFRELPMRPQYEETPLSMDPRVMAQTYGISVPYKVDPNAPTNFTVLTNQIMALPTQAAGSNFFTAWCCSANNIAPETTEIKQ